MANIMKRIFSKEESPSKDFTVFSARFDHDKQIVSSLKMVGAGFEAKGGTSLMLTEAVENGVDAIIKFNQLHSKKVDGKIKVIIDKSKNRILVTDNGTGILDIRHVCEKPFDSIKELDDTQTGKFARGLQGFRAFCDNLTYLTKRCAENIPKEEKNSIKSTIAFSETAEIEFQHSTSTAKVMYIPNSDFKEYSNFEHGTIAIYENWKKGVFEAFNVKILLRRLQHHFGELIRSGKIEISVVLDEGKIQGIGPVQIKEQLVEPRDYSAMNPISVQPISYKNEKIGKRGEIKFNLFLCEKGARDRWNYPYLLWKGRPVGDGFIAEIDEFSENPLWANKFLTGYIICDFCEINPLRLALETGEERDFLFTELRKTEKILEKRVKEYSKGVYELKLQKQVTDLVKELQLFFKSKNIFNFKIAKSTGFLSKEDNEVEIVQLAPGKGDNPDLESPHQEGEGAELYGSNKFETTFVKESEIGDAKTLNPDIGSHGEGQSNVKIGGPDKTAISNENSMNGNGFIKSEKGFSKPEERVSPHEIGGNKQGNKKGKRHKPKGFGLTFQDDEFNDNLSWFDEVNSMVIINSQHPRYMSRVGEGESNLRKVMDYLAELYIWEITKLVYKAEEEKENIAMKFFDLKFEWQESKKEQKSEEPAIENE